MTGIEFSLVTKIAAGITVLCFFISIGCFVLATHYYFKAMGAIAVLEHKKGDPRT